MMLLAINATHHTLLLVQCLNISEVHIVSESTAITSTKVIFIYLLLSKAAFRTNTSTLSRNHKEGLQLSD